MSANRVLASARRSDALLADLAAELKTLSDDELARVLPEVSGWSIGRQAHHMLDVTNRIHAFIEKMTAGEAPEEAPRPMTFIGRVVLFAGTIPRGRGKAPFDPPPSPPRDEVERLGDSATNCVLWFQKYQSFIAECTLRRNHPVFGGLTAAQWVRFNEIHLRHHLSIVRDIRATMKPGA